MTVLHEPRLDTIMMVEKAILDAEDYPTKTQLWHSLPKGIQYQTLTRILDYLEASGTIAYHGRKIIYTGMSSEKLHALIEKSVRAL